MTPPGLEGGVYQKQWQRGEDFTQYRDVTHSILLIIVGNDCEQNPFLPKKH